MKKFITGALSLIIAVSAATGCMAEQETTDETTIVMQIGNSTATVNGIETEIEPGEDVSPVISDGRTLFLSAF